MSFRTRTTVMLWVVAIGVTAPALAQDLLSFDDGSRLAGRIKRVERGEVTFRAPIGDGDIYLDWSRIVLIESQRVFQFQLSDGLRFLGRIQQETDPDAGTLVVEFAGVTETYNMDDVILVVETVGNLAGLLKVSVGVGATLTKSNDYRQITADSSLSYETTRYTVGVALNSIFTRQRESDDTNRHGIDLRLTRQLGSNWGLSVINTYLRNDEQSLDLRTVVGGGPSRTFIPSSRTNIVALAGVVWNNERYASEAELDTNNEMEALLGMDFSFFEFRQWELRTTYLVYPSVSSTGRVRQSLNAQLRLRLISGKSFWWNLSQTLDLDNEPPEGVTGTDYVTVTSFSWSFP